MQAILNYASVDVVLAGPALQPRKAIATVTDRDGKHGAH
jgi:hypothetical protein